MARTHKNQKITVEALLQIKRNERPQGEFWDSFEQDFHRRRLNALVERPAWRDYLFHPAFKAMALAMPALLLVALAVVWENEEIVAPSPLVVSRDVEQPAMNKPVARVDISREEYASLMDAGSATSQFVVDAIQTSNKSSHFRKVLYTPAIRLSAPTGASYVRDNMSSSAYKVTTADMRLGRNF
jgi:hypothetical protein